MRKIIESSDARHSNQAPGKDSFVQTEKMTRFNRVLVALDLSKIDKSVVRYVQYMKNVFEPEKIYIAHVVPHSLYSATYFTDPVASVAKEALLKTLQDYPSLKNNDQVEVLVTEGSPLTELLNWIEDLKIDLFVVGLKKYSRGSGVLPRKVVRKADCPILFVPKIKQPSINHVWVPVDFSKPSVGAMKYAEELRSAVEGLKVSAHHAVYLPAAVAMKLTWTDAQVDRLKEDAGEAFDRFVSHEKLESLTYQRVITRSSRENPAREILNTAKEQGADLIVISPEGHSKLDLLFLGSVCEKLLSLNSGIPTLVLKS